MTIYEHDHSILGFTWTQLTSGVVNPVSHKKRLNTHIRCYVLGEEATDTPTVLTFNSDEIPGIYRAILPTV